VTDPLLQGGVAVVLAAAAVVLAAKAHGRQVRLRREAEGVLTVDFRGPNPPVVEAIWRRDRVGFWSIFVMSVAGYGSLAAAGVLPVGPVVGGLLGLAAALVDAFLFMALWWAFELRRVQGRSRFGWGWALGAVALLAAALVVALA
jgi:hypothetical protein